MIKIIPKAFIIIGSFFVSTYAHADYCADKAKVKVGIIETTNSFKYGACKAECSGFSLYVNSVAGGCLARSGDSTNKNNVREAINILINSDTFKKSDFNGVQVRFCDALELGGAGGMVPRPRTILLGPNYRDLDSANLSVTLAHEMIHILQYRRWGAEGFQCRYGEQIAKGRKTARGNFIEDEAYNFESQYVSDINSGKITISIEEPLPDQRLIGPEDQYLTGNWNGDGRDNIAVRRDSEIIMDFNFDKNRDHTFNFGRGNAEDQYLVGDWNGDGRDNIAVRRGSEIIMDFNFDKNRDHTFTFGRGL